MAELNLSSFAQTIASQGAKPVDINRGLDTFLAFRQQAFNEQLQRGQLAIQERAQDNEVKRTALLMQAEANKQAHLSRELLLEQEDLVAATQFAEAKNPMGDIPIFKSTKFQQLGKLMGERQQVLRDNDFAFQMQKQVRDQVKELVPYFPALAHRVQGMLQSGDVEQIQRGMDLLEENGIYPGTDGQQIGIAAALVKRGTSPDLISALALVRQRSSSGGKFVFGENGQLLFAEGVPGGDLTQAMTMGARGKAQERVVAMRPALLGLRRVKELVKNFGFKSLGVSGQVRRNVLNQAFGQIPGFEDLVDPQVTTTQVALGIFVEKVLKKISEDTRFSIPDRAAITRIIPSPDKLLQSPDDAIAALDELERHLGLSFQTDLSVLGEGRGSDFLLKTFKTPGDIRQAYRDSFISRDEAVKLLQQFTEEDLAK